MVIYKCCNAVGGNQCIPEYSISLEIMIAVHTSQTVAHCFKEVSLLDKLLLVCEGATKL